MSESGLSKGGIKPKGSEATRDTVLIGSGQNKLLSNVGGRVIYGLGMQDRGEVSEKGSQDHGLLPSIYARIVHEKAMAPGGLHEGDSRFGISIEGIPL